MKYIYPALFCHEKDGGFSVSFPDISGCYSQGETLLEALEMATDALNLMLWEKEERKEKIPDPSYPNMIKPKNEKDFIAMISADTTEYRKKNDKKAIKKTLSIPKWLNSMAIENNINFSNVLKKALIKELKI